MNKTAKEIYFHQMTRDLSNRITDRLAPHGIVGDGRKNVYEEVNRQVEKFINEKIESIIEYYNMGDE